MLRQLVINSRKANTKEAASKISAILRLLSSGLYTRLEAEKEIAKLLSDCMDQTCQALELAVIEIERQLNEKVN